MIELDNSGTSHKNLEKQKNKDIISVGNKDIEVPSHVYRVVQLVFRFFQLLCENHNHELQVILFYLFYFILFYLFIYLFI